MRGSNRSLILLVLPALALAPSRTVAQGVSVSPNCGGTTTHFFLSSGGWPIPAKCDSCVTGYSVSVDGHIVFDTPSPFGQCRSGFTVDLDTLFCSDCGVIRTAGTHTVCVFGLYECTGNGGSAYDTVQTTFTRQGTPIADPWIVKPLIISGVAAAVGDTFNFLPQSACGFPACDTVHLIQVVREIGIYPQAGTRFLTAAEQLRVFPNRALRALGDSIDAWTTDAHYHIDLHPKHLDEPYMTVPPVEAAKVGRTGPPADTARFADAVRRGDVVYPDSVLTIVLDVEINAFCAGGAGRGQYLGRCTWHWERTKGSSARPFGNPTIQQTGVAQPTPEFLAAVALYLSRTTSKTQFLMPTITPPEKGGVKCPP